MMINIKEKINALTLKAYNDFLNTDELYILVYTDRLWQKLPQYTIKNVNDMLAGDVVVNGLSILHTDNFDIYHKKLAYPFKNTANHCDLFIDYELQAKFYYFWKNYFDINELSYFYALSPRIIPLENSLRFLKNNSFKKDFYEQFTQVKYPLLPLQTIQAFEYTIELLHKTEIDIETVSTILLKYCTNNKTLFKRIECQNILYNFVNQYSLPGNFKKFYPDVEASLEQALFTINPATSLYINKKTAFSKYQNPLLNDKLQLTKIFKNTIEWFNKPENAPELDIKNIYIENTTEPFIEYNIIVSFNTNINMELLEIIDYIVYHLCHDKLANDFTVKIPKIYFNYLLQKKIPHKTNIKTTKKI